MKTLNKTAYLLLISMILCSCKKEIISNTVQQADASISASVQSGIIDSVINLSVTILPLPSRNGDILSKSKTQYLDLNKDKVQDFAFNLYWSRWDYPYQNNDASTPSVYATSSGDSLLTDNHYYTDYFGARFADFAKAILLKTDIRSAATYQTSGYLCTFYHVPPYYYSGGELNGKGNQYLGVKFTDKKARTFYGWIKVNLSTDGNTLKIIEFAYNSKPNASISAGQR